MNHFLPARTDLLVMDDTDPVCFALVIQRTLLSEKFDISFLATPRTDNDHLSSFQYPTHVDPIDGYARVGPQPVDNLISRVSSNCKAVDSYESTCLNRNG